MKPGLKFSIITPSFNQAQYIEETIESVLEQGVNLEYIIMDGGSTDGTIEILEKYRTSCSYIEIKKDNGQAHAINKGFKMASGDIVSWINSDDLYLKETLKNAEHFFLNSECRWMTADTHVIDEKGQIVDHYKSEVPDDYFNWLNLLVRGYSIPLLQPATFFRRDVFDMVGYLNEEMHYSFDHEFFFRIHKKFGAPGILNDTLSEFRIHKESKTSLMEPSFKRENRRTGYTFLHDEPIKRRIYLYLVYLREKYIRG